MSHSPFTLSLVFHLHLALANYLNFVSMACTRDFQKVLRSFKGTGISYSLLLLLLPWVWITWFKLGFDIHHWSIFYLGYMQDHIGTVSHLQFGYFDLVNPVDQVKHGSQGSDSKNNIAYICSRHAQDQYCGFSFESLALVLLISDYYHLIIGQMIKFYSRWQYDWFS